MMREMWPFYLGMLVAAGLFLAGHEVAGFLVTAVGVAGSVCLLVRS